MKHTTISNSMRFAPLAILAIALFAILGLMALNAYAQEAEEDVASTQVQFQNNQIERRELYDTQKEERGELRTEQREERQATLEERANALKEELGLRKFDREQKMQGFKAKLSTQMQVRLGEYVARIVERMNAAINRLEQIADRVLTRLERVEEEKDVDLSNARDELEQVYIAIYDARANVKLFSDISTDTMSSENPSATVRELRDSAKLAKDSIKAVHTALSNTVQLIKVGMVEKKEVEDCEDKTGDDAEDCKKDVDADETE